LDLPTGPSKRLTFWVEPDRDTSLATILRSCHRLSPWQALCFSSRWCGERER